MLGKASRIKHGLARMAFIGIVIVVIVIILGGAYAGLVLTRSPSSVSSSSSTTSTSSTNSLQSLIQGAQSEGQLVLVGATSACSAYQNFSQAYNINVTVTCLHESTGSLYNLISTAYQAGKSSYDVILESDTTLISSLNNGSMVLPYAPPERSGISSQNYFGDYGTNAMVSAWTVYYNTNLVPPDLVPQSWNTFLNATWQSQMKGKFCMYDPTTNPLSQSFYWSMQGAFNNNQTQWVDFLHALANLNPRLYPSSPQMAVDVGTGTCQMAIGWLIHVYTVGVTDNYPIGFAWNITTTYGGPIIETIYANAAHPNAAKLFENWLLSPEGQTAVGETGVIPVRPGASIVLPHASNLQVGIWTPMPLSSTTEYNNYVAMLKSIF